MPHEIFTQEVFEKQVNGTIFYKEGKLQDFPYAGPGVFESWRYNFDSGKQVFRAEKSNKVFEKRLVKDNYGNPKWTGWIEIPDAEAHGIQAIAINDRPLQLPNGDGAIKLQITPQMIDSYTKGEIHSLIENKIEEQYSGAYIYVQWIDGCTTAREVLEKAYPDGGQQDVFYLVEPHGQTSGIQEKAEYFIWARNSVNELDWIPADIPDMRAFVSYPVFYEHTDDTHFHLKGEEERTKWDAVSGLVDEQVIKLDEDVQGLKDEINTQSEAARNYTKNVEDKIDNHAALIGERDSVHITEEERLKWEAGFTNSINALPADGQRYVALNSGYQLAFEQAKTGDRESRQVWASPSVFIKSGDILVENLLPDFTEIAKDSILVDAQLEISGVNAQGTSFRLETVGDTDDIVKISKDYYDNDNYEKIWKIGNKGFDKIILVSNDKDKSFTLTGLKLYLFFKKLSGVEIGNSTLPLNLNGSETEPTYNGESLLKPINEKVEDVRTELNDKLLDYLKMKVNVAGNNSYRYDVRGNSLIKSLIQTDENTGTKEHIIQQGTTVVDVQQNGVVIDGIKSKLASCGGTPINVELVINHANTTGKDIYFNTDEPLVRNSPLVKDNRFDLNWPGVLDNEFDKIFVRDGNLKMLTGGGVGAKLVITYITAGKTALVNEELKLNWEQFAKLFKLNANEDIILNSDQEILITAEDAVKIASKLIELGADKDYGVDGDVIKVYGQEIDDRYANREIFETAVEDINQAIEDEKNERENEDAALSAAIDELASLIEDEAATREEADNQEREERIAGDEEISGILDEHEDRMDVLSGEILVASNNLSGEVYNRERALADEKDERLSGDAFLSGLIKEADERMDEISGYFEDYYTKEDVDETLEDYYTKDEADELLDEKADKSDTYTKDEVYNTDETYTKEEVNDLIVNGSVAEMKKYEVNGDTDITLESGYSVYQIILHNHSNITFHNVIPNRKYTLYFDRIDIAYNFSIKNTKLNAAELTEFNNEDTNQIPNTRTVVEIIGNNELAEDGMIIEAVIPKVSCKFMAGYKIIVGNIEGTLFDGLRRDKAVDALGYKTGEVYAYGNAGGVTTIRSQFKNTDGITGKDSGWKNPDGDAPGWVIYEKSNPSVILGSGKIGIDSNFQHTGTSTDDLIIDFRPVPQMVKPAIDVNIDAGKIVSKVGFDKSYQLYYEEIKLEIKMQDNPGTKTGYFIYTMKNSIGMTQVANSSAWTFFAKSCPEHFEGTTAVLYIEPLFYTKIYDLRYEVDNSPITDKVNLVWFEDEKQNNKINFLFEPANANDKITIIDCSNNLEVIGSTTGTNENESARLRLIRKPADGERAQFTIQTASGTQLKVDVLALKPVEELKIVGEVIANNRNSEDFIHKNPGEDNTYEAHIDWGGSDVSTKNGVWSVEGNNFTVTNDGTDKAIVTAKTVGKSTLVFTPNFNPMNVVRLPIEVFVHVIAGKIDVARLDTSEDRQLTITWYDKEGGTQSIDPSVMTSVDGKWEIVGGDGTRATINETSGRITVSNKKIPDGTTFEPLKIRFTSWCNKLTDKLNGKAGPSLVLDADFEVHRGSYWLTFNTDDENSNGVNGVAESSIKEADFAMLVQLNFTNGYEATDNLKAQIAALPAVENIKHQNGASRFNFKMPYNDLTIVITTKKI